MFFSLASVIQLLLHYKYLILFPITVIEGPIITIIAGFLVSTHILNFYLAYGVIVAGDIAGDFFLYAIGRWGRTKSIARWTKYIGVTEERLEHLEKHFDKHSGKTLIIGKLSHVVGAAPLIGAGAVRMSFSKFFWFNLIATIPKSMILLLIGFYFGSSYARISHYFDLTAIFMIVLAIILIIVYFIIRRLARSEMGKLE